MKYLESISKYLLVIGVTLIAAAIFQKNNSKDIDSKNFSFTSISEVRDSDDSENYEEETSQQDKEQSLEVANLPTNEQHDGDLEIRPEQQEAFLQELDSKVNAAMNSISKHESSDRESERQSDNEETIEFLQSQFDFQKSDAEEISEQLVNFKKQQQELEAKASEMSAEVLLAEIEDLEERRIEYLSSKLNEEELESFLTKESDNADKKLLAMSEVKE